MSSSHDHTHSIRNIRLAFWLNLSFTLLEFIGGFYINSLAVISDALHDFGDSLALGLAWYLQKISIKKSNPKYSYGYKRFLPLGGVFNGVILMAGSFIIVITALPRLFSPQVTEPKGMIFLAILGIVVNGVAVFNLRKEKSINLKVAYLHLLEDVLGWVALLLGAILIYYTGLQIIDTVLSIGIALFVIWNAFKLIKKSFSIFLQTSPENLEVKKIINSIESLEEIDSVHDCHAWSLDGEHSVMSLHAVIKEKVAFEKQLVLKKKIREIVHSESPSIHLTIEIEHKEEDCQYIDCTEN